MEAWMLAFVIGAAVPVAIDVGGHWLNRRLLLSAHARLDEAEERGRLMLAKLEAWDSKPGVLRNGLDPRDAVELREAKKMERAALLTEKEGEVQEFLVERYGERAIAAFDLVKNLAGEGWPAALLSAEGWTRRLRPFLAIVDARIEAPTRNTNTNGWR